ncbi:hypothetical protein, partial [Lactobacillus equicursoris]|uniref:hypothetical protein n=1 Tax=Lactobacillus equicursoris TaxID=420645 RepID=UPI0039934464
MDDMALAVCRPCPAETPDWHFHASCFFSFFVMQETVIPAARPNQEIQFGFALLPIDNVIHACG